MAYASWSVTFGEQPSAAKWNILGTNDSSFNDGTGIAVSAITPEKLLTGTGTTHIWQTWTPTLVNLSGGTLNYAKYIQIGKTVFFRLKYTLGGAGVAGNVTFSTPTTINADMVASGEIIQGSVQFQDTGTASFFGSLRWSSSTTINILTHITTGTYPQSINLSSTVPHTWASTDIISCSGSYEAA